MEKNQREHEKTVGVRSSYDDDEEEEEFVLDKDISELYADDVADYESDCYRINGETFKEQLKGLRLCDIKWFNSPLEIVDFIEPLWVTEKEDNIHMRILLLQFYGEIFENAKLKLQKK